MDDIESLLLGDVSPTKGNELKARPNLSKDTELFRAIHPARVLQCFAQVFAAGGDSYQEESVLLENDHADADAVFYAGQQVEQVGAFISHAWSAPRWLKALALLYYMNIELAVVASILTWATAMAGMVILNGPTGMGGHHGLLLIFVGIPLLVFAVCFVCGHRLRVPVETVWLDKLCIHQTRPDKKVAGIAALPEVVANSDRLLVLWSDTYFERLWCNAELATFAALNGADNMDFVPLWLAPWILATLAFEFIPIFLSSRLFFLIPMCGGYFAETSAADTPGLVSFLALFVGVGTAFMVSYCPLLLVTWHCLRVKLDLHEDMLRQCSEYTLAGAKCAIESDRSVVEDLVRSLLREDVANPIMEFNAFVNNVLARHISRRVGHLSYIPYKQCLLLFLPLAFSAAVNVWGCDDMPCHATAVAELGEGATPAQQMLTNAVAWAVGIFGIYPSVYPVMFSGMVATRTKLKGLPCIVRIPAEFVVMLVSYAYMGFHEGFAAGLINASSQEVTASIHVGGVWVFVTLIYLLLLIQWNKYLYRFAPSE